MGLMIDFNGGQDIFKICVVKYRAFAVMGPTYANVQAGNTRSIPAQKMDKPRQFV
jgi:hypothetical protein